MASPEVHQLKDDETFFEYFFKQMEQLASWTLHINTPDKKVYYKYENELKMMSTLAECIVEAPLCNVIAMYSETDLFA